MPSPMAHQLGFMYGLVLPAMLGATAVLQDIFEPGEMARQIRQEGATFTMGATPFLSDLTDYVEKAGAGTPTLRVFVSAGAPIPRALVTKAQKRARRRDHFRLGHVGKWRRDDDPSRRTPRRKSPRPMASRCPAWRCV